MAIDTRRANVSWNVTSTVSGDVTWDTAQVAVLMDIRDELQKLNALLHCDVSGMPMKFSCFPRAPRRKMPALTAKRKT